MSQDTTPASPAWQTKFDLTGQTFGRLTVTGKDQRFQFWKCRCVCGVETAVRQTNLRSGKAGSCGCLRRDISAKRFTKHGLWKSSEYRSWTSMIARCYLPSTFGYPFYGGRGVWVCEAWRHSFEAFVRDMGMKPTAKHTIDRIDSKGNYEPGNCRWATRKEQGNNRKDNHLITFNGETKNVTAWAESTGIPRHALYVRLGQLGWDSDRAISTPHKPRNKRLK